MTRTPSRSEVERAWVMRRFQLDEEAGIETDSLEYSREFRNFWKAETNAALAAIERVKETLSLHNPNGRLVKEVLAALDGAPEPDAAEKKYAIEYSSKTRTSIHEQ